MLVAGGTAKLNSMYCAKGEDARLGTDTEETVGGGGRAVERGEGAKRGTAGGEESKNEPPPRSDSSEPSTFFSEEKLRGERGAGKGGVEGTVGEGTV